MHATIRQLTVGLPKTILHDGKEVTTGIFKKPVSSRVSVSFDGIAGDGQADLSVHGGRDKAVYVYPEVHYATWSRELGIDELEPAQFGENLTVSELSEQTVTLGDTYRFGSVVAVVAQPRLPCFKLGIRMHDDEFPARFLQSGRLGFYLRIEEEGETGPGDTFELLDRPDHGITIHELWHFVFRDVADVDKANGYLDLLPYIDEGWKRRLRLKAKPASDTPSASRHGVS
jgi:MOSC domain-containing protein YiiM